LNLEELYIDDAPLGERDLSPPLAAALDRARKAMRDRSYLDARQALAAAAVELQSDADHAAYEEMVHLYTLWSAGWAKAAESARHLKPGDSLSIWSGPALVQKASETEIVLLVDGAPQLFAARMGEMDVRLAAALVAHRARQTGLGLDAHVAALLALDRDGTREAARAACVEAAQRGAIIDPLIRELRRRE
jgi:hypothetical protein